MQSNDLVSARRLYLDLLKRALTNWIRGHEEFVPVGLSGIGKIIHSALVPDGAVLIRPHPFDENKRQLGQDWPVPIQAHTMIGLRRLDNLQYCIEQIIADQIPGDLIETGVWKGGATIFMRGVLKAYGDDERCVWVADSFNGLPPPNADDYPADEGDVHHTIASLRVTELDVRKNFAAYGLLDDQVRFLPGWFKDSLPRAPIDRLAILRLDGDMYESTMDALNALYAKLSPGGFVIVDDYCIRSCRDAIHDFRHRHGISTELIDIDGSGGYWRKEA